MYRAASEIDKKVSKDKARIRSVYTQLGKSENEIANECERVEEHAYDELKRLCNRVQVMNKIISGFKDEKVQNFWYLITLRPDESKWEFNLLRDKVEKFCQRKIFLQCEYAFEQTGKELEAMGTGYHCHLVAESDYKSYEIIQALTKEFKNCMVKVGNEKRKYLKTESDLEYAKNYIRGDKHKVEKEAAVAIDKLWRQKLNLEDLYEVSKGNNMKLIKSGVIVSCD